MGPDADTHVLAFAGAAEWEAWLTEHGEQAGEAWLLIAKKGSGSAGLAIGDAGDVALCFGWIDSHRRSYDANHYLQRFSRRRPGSPWSRLNVERAEALTAAGRMRPRGLAEIAAAQADGRWAAAYASQRTAAIPPDLAAALEESERAKTAFERLGKSGQYAVILPILKATGPAVRAARVQKAIAGLEARA